MQEVIIYLIDFKSFGNNYYGDVIIDFMNEDGFKLYQNLTHEKDTVGSILEMQNVRTNKRLIKGAYYALNVNLLSKLRRREVEDGSLVFAGFYDCKTLYVEDNNTQYGFISSNSNDNQLFLSHSYPLPRIDFSPDENYIRLMSNITIENRNMSIVVNDVGQANWNEIRFDDQVKIVYDIGAPLKAPKNKIKKLLAYCNNYSQSKPLLIISHWDLDHYHCLICINDNELRMFCGVIFPNMVKSLTSQRVAWRLIRSLGRNNVSCVNNPPRSRKKPYPFPHMLRIVGPFAIFICERSRNINYSGIIFSTNGHECNVVCSGDSTLSQASDVLLKHISCDNNISGHILVVPHHGGYYTNENYRYYRLPNGIVGKEGIISVDENDNNYGHPNDRTIRLLVCVPFSIITRTDCHGVIERQI